MVATWRRNRSLNSYKYTLHDMFQMVRMKSACVWCRRVARDWVAPVGNVSAAGIFFSFERRQWRCSLLTDDNDFVMNRQAYSLLECGMDASNLLPHLSCGCSFSFCEQSFSSSFVFGRHIMLKPRLMRWYCTTTSTCCDVFSLPSFYFNIHCTTTISTQR